MLNAFGIAVLLVLVTAVLWAVRESWRGRRVDFVHRAPASAGDADLLLDHALPVLAHAGFSLVAAGGRTTILERRYFPAWTILAAIFFFPFGLLALLARARETVTIVGGPDRVEVHGTCAKPTADFLLAMVDELAAAHAAA